MIGCRPLDDEEINLILDFGFTGVNALRNKVLFMLGLTTGFRISELLSLKLEDVVDPDGTLKDSLRVARKNTKGKIKSRRNPISDRVAPDLLALVLSLSVQGKTYLFSSRQGGDRAIDVSQAWRVIRDALWRSKIFESGTHVMRKTFAKKVYEATGKNIYETQKALGHKSIDSTTHYLSFDRDQLDQTIKDLF